MPSVGVRLKEERESRGKTIEEMADATGIGRSYLEALERDEIRELPGRAFGKLYIRAYAEVLGFDPQPWIDAYDRERRSDPDETAETRAPEPTRPRAVEAAIERWRESKVKAAREPEEVALEQADAPLPTPVEDTPAPAGPPPAPAPAPANRRSPLAVASLIVVLASVVAVVTYVTRRGDGEERPPSIESAAAPSSAPAPAPAPAPPTVPPAAADAAIPPAAKPVPATPPPAKRSAPLTTEGTLTVTEFGVGTRVVNSRLQGESDRFDVGQRVCFQTRILGGERGGIVRHVWIRDGAVEQSIPLRVGARDWRTFSNKTLGRAGSWAVEARDGAGRVLARAAFTCAPAGRGGDH